MSKYFYSSFKSNHEILLTTILSKIPFFQKIQMGNIFMKVI